MVTSSPRTKVSNALSALITLVIAAPAILWFDGPVVHAVVAGAAAAGIAIVSATMRPGETIFLVSLARPVVLLCAVPALWMLLQVVPLGLFAHPIWASAQAALAHPVVGSISIDVGAGVQALGRYLTMVGIGLLTAATAVDRQRAERILFALVAATAFVSLAAMAGKMFGLGAFADAAGLAPAQATDCIVIGTIVASAGMIRTWDRYETRRARPGRSVLILAMTFAACAAAFALCFGSLLALAPSGVLVPAFFGTGALAAIALIRRLGLGRSGIAAICVPAVVAAALLGAGNLGFPTQDISLAFATPSSDALAAAAQRMLADAPLLGTGAGTFGAMAPIYHDIDDNASFMGAPTFAAAAAVELGRPFLWFLVLSTGGVIVFFLHAALRRGRDSFYAAAGAGTLIALLLLIFMNAGLQGTATAMIATATVALALAQSKSRSRPR